MKRNVTTALVAVASAAALLASVAGCSMGSSSGSSGSSGNNSNKTLTVWVMTGDLNDATMKAINDEFTKQTGAKVNVQTQQWTNIVTKITTALSTSTPPDIIDIGNTQVAGFAASGGLMDLTSHRSDLMGGNTWLKGLEEPATINGKLYAVPSFGATRVVIYNKKIWSASGINQPPTSYQQLQADLDKIAADHKAQKDFSAFYMPGKYWYSGIQYIWGAGGDMAAQTNGTWKGATSSANSVKGLAAWKTFQNTYSTAASRTLDEATPDQNQLFAGGKAAAMLGNNVDLAIKNNPSLTTNDIGTFPMPNVDGGTQPSMIAGSDWGIAAKSPNQDLALKWAKIAASSTIQQNYVYGSSSWLPNSTEMVNAVMKSSGFPAYKKGFFEAALNSKATPASPNWATLEGDNSITDMFSSIASGSASVANATKTFDSHADSVFAGK